VRLCIAHFSMSLPMDAISRVRGRSIEWADWTKQQCETRTERRREG